MAEIRDYNGEGPWSRESIERRFADYAATYGTTLGKLDLITHKEGDVTWVYPLVESVIKGIGKRDPACIELGVELIEDSSSMPFGMTLKSNTARALRRSFDALTPNQIDRVRRRVANMLIAKYMPREFVQYVKLVMKVGFGGEAKHVRSQADLSDRWVRHFLAQLEPSENK